MKFIIAKITCLVLCAGFASSVAGQYTWKLSKEKDGIKVYQSELQNSSYKAIKVECTLEGNYDKLIAVLRNVDGQKDWVYHNKTAYIVKKINPHEFYYYTEASLPWPMSNRDAVVHLKMDRDSLNRFLKIISVSVPDYIAEKSGKVRVTRSTISWNVTMPTTNTIKIIYIFEAEPGGSIPAWVANAFVDKGPYETFKKLGEILKQ
ncbi:MAG TPA: START domain-containing protein [Chitinophagaceae bacterium]